MTPTQANQFMAALRAGRTLRRITSGEKKFGPAIASFKKFRTHCMLYPGWGAETTHQGGYLIAKQASTGFPGLGNLKAEAMGEANQYCQSQGREFLLTNEMETQPPYLLGNYPRAEISF